MSDQEACDLFSGKGRRRSQNPRELRAEPLVRKGRSQDATFPFANVGKGRGPSLSNSVARSSRLSELRAEANRLNIEIEEARALVGELGGISEPYQQAFEAAHLALAALHHQRKMGKIVTKEVMLKAYDERMEAGHAWNPHKKRLKEASAWLKTIQTRLTEVNQEIEE